MDIISVFKDETGKFYIGTHLGKEVTRKSTLAKAVKAVAAYIKGMS